MSHPEYTLKQIIEKQNDKIDALIKVFGTYVQTMYVHQGNIAQEQGKQILEMLDAVLKS